MSALDEIRKMKAELEQKIATDGKAALRATFREFFDANPTIEAVRWRQYTPYFNDGDPCTFSVNDFGFRVSGAPEDSGDYEDGFESTWSMRNNALGPVCSAFEREASDDDVYLAVFGDHAMITATRDGFEVEEYSHD